MTNRDIIVIGGSAGATAPLKQTLGALPVDLPAAVFLPGTKIPSRSAQKELTRRALLNSGALFENSQFLRHALPPAIVFVEDREAR